MHSFSALPEDPSGDASSGDRRSGCLDSIDADSFGYVLLFCIDTSRGVGWLLRQDLYSLGEEEITILGSIWN